LDNNFTATYFPDVFITDETNNQIVGVPSSIAAVGAIALNDFQKNVWFAPAGFNRGALGFVNNVQVRLNQADRDNLYLNRINPISTFPGAGYVIFGQKTMQLRKSALDRVNVRRMLLEVKRIVVGIAQRLIFEPNNAQTRARFVASVVPQLSNIQMNEGIEQFKVICDATNNSSSDVIQNKLNGKIVLVPTRAIEFIAIDFIITNGNVEFV
jgi:phage tail sheath protein FI